MAGQRRSAAGTIRDDLEALIQQALFPDLLQCPPLGLNIIIFISDIRMLHICPKAYGTGEILPHPFILPDTFLTFFDKWLQSVRFNLIFSIKIQLFFNLQLHRKPMGIPAGFTQNLIALHGAVARNHVFDYARQHMADMRLSVGCRRTVVKCICLAVISDFNAFFKYIIVFPELLNLFFPFRKVQVRRYLFVHAKPRFSADPILRSGFRRVRPCCG